MKTSLVLSGIAMTLVALSRGTPATPAPMQEKHAEHEGHEGKGSIRLSPRALQMASLEIQPAGGGTLARTLEGPGEIVLNEDRVAHLTPRVPGVAVKVLKSVGDEVAEGDVLAVLESAELGNAKIDYFTARTTLDLARLDLEREQAVHDNTQKLLELLKGEPEPAEIDRKTRGAAIGDNKTRLVASYSALRQAQSAWGRAQKLKQDRLISDGDYDLAAREYESAQAAYRGTFEGIEFAQKQCLVQAQRAVRLAENARRNTERRLHIMGLTEPQVASLSGEEDAAIARFELRAPFAGTLIEKHLTLGEAVAADSNCFTLADLSTVWCHVRVSPVDAGRVRPGQAVHVAQNGRDEPRVGRIAMVSPLVSEKTRAGFVRAVLDNASLALRPGQFVTGAIVLEELKPEVAVPAAALQVFEGKDIVFVQGDAEGEFLPRPVQRGFSDGRWVEIKAGLKPGEKIVVRNSFILKAELGKGGGGHEH